MHFGTLGQWKEFGSIFCLSLLVLFLLLDCADTAFIGLELQRRNTSVRPTSQIGIPVKLKDQFALTLFLT